MLKKSLLAGHACFCVVYSTGMIVDTVENAPDLITELRHQANYWQSRHADAVKREAAANVNGGGKVCRWAEQKCTSDMSKIALPRWSCQEKRS